MKVSNTNDIKPTKVNALIYAPSGYGKTTLAKTLPPKTIVISLEAGLLSLKGSNVDYVEVDPKRKLESLREYLGEIVKSDYDTIFIDSLSEISQMFLEEAEKKFPDARNNMQKYGLYNQMMMAFIKYCRDLDKNVFFTALQKDDKDEIGRITHIPDLVGSISKKCQAYFDFVFCLMIFEKDDEKKRVLLTDAHDGYVAKDRSIHLDQYEPADLGLIIKKVFHD